MGVKMEPTAAYEPKARQTRSNGVPLVCSFIPVSINRRLIEINPQLLHGKVRPAHHQPMVEKDGMVARLKEMQGELSLEQFGALANKSAQAALKWLKGGNMKDATIHALVSHERFRGRGYTVEWVRYGTKAKDGSNELSLLAQDVARRWMELSSERQDWFRDLIFTMHFMEQRFPIMRKGRPKGEHYSGFERAVEADMRDNHKTKQKP